jgi:hypothetical protein
VFDNLATLPTPVLFAFAVYIVTTTLLFNVNITAGRLLQILLLGVLFKLLFIISSVLSSILLTSHVLVDHFPTLDAVIFLTNRAREFCFMFKPKSISTAWSRTPSDTSIFIKSFVKSEITELLIFVFWNTIFDILTSHLFPTAFLRTEDLKFKLVNFRLNVLLQTLSVEDVLTLSQWDIL